MGTSTLLVWAWAAVVLMAVACGDGATNPSPVDPPDELGPFAVGHSAFIAVDPGRGDRPLPVDLWYPVEPGDEAGSSRTVYPLAAGIGLDSAVAFDEPPASGRDDQILIVFSHGYGGINTQSTDLMEILASHGFVVASVSHTGNTQSDQTDSFDEAAAHRVPDVSFVIDTMIARNRDPADGFYRRLDEQRVGVVGHSFGAMTSIGMAGGWAGGGPDPRVAAIAPISAVIDGDLQKDKRTGPNAGFSDEQLARIVVPVLLIGGTEDVSVPIGNNALAFEKMVRAPSVYKVDIVGANHTHFANVCAIGDLLIDIGIGQESWPAVGAEDLLEPYAETCSPDAFPIAEATRLTNLYVVSFFQRHLRGRVGYAPFLTPDYASREPAITLSVR